MLLTELDAFYLEHRGCGELAAEITNGDPGWAVMQCSCGVLIRAADYRGRSVFRIIHRTAGGRLPELALSQREDLCGEAPTRTRRGQMVMR